MSTIFISDLHLCPQEPIIISSFLQFLKSDAIHANALYILGDLFEVWIGDDDPEPLYHDIAVALKKLKQSGVPCYFIHGNRDFLLGARFMKESGMHLLSDNIVLKLYGRKILITHGDLLCSDDSKYQKFRRKIRQPFIQKLFLFLPLCWRIKIAFKIRNKSQYRNQYKSKLIMDVNQEEVKKIMLSEGVRWMIHGHTHRPAIHRLNINNSKAYRIVLGSWQSEGSMIKMSSHAIELILFPLSTRQGLQQ